MKVVNQPIMKKDAMALVTGKPVFTNDKAPKECLIVKLLRSPYANAMIKSINTQFAMKVPGIEAIYTWEDVPQERFTMAGQTYPELSPYDRQILDQHVRYVGDPVAIVAGENEKCVDQAIKMLRVEYEVLPANLDPRKAMAAPYTSLSFMPTGGINPENVKKYLEYDRIFACGGSWMVKGKLIAEGRFDEIEKLTREAAEIVKNIRG